MVRILYLVNAHKEGYSLNNSSKLLAKKLNQDESNSFCVPERFNTDI